MLIAFILGIAAAVMGWIRAGKRGGTTGDRLQYAAAHGIPAFLIGMILVAIAGNLGWLG